MIGLEGVSTPALFDLIGSVYDCALEPAQWAGTCRQAADLVGSTAGGLCVHDPRQRQQAPLCVFGYPPGFLEQLGHHYAESPMATTDGVAPLGEVSALSMADAALRQSRFVHAVLQPFGILDLLWFPALRRGGRTASLHAARRGSDAPYQAQEVRLFKLLAPHVCRALALSDVLDLRTLKSEMLEQTLDGLVAGVFLTSGDGHVVYMNHAAERQIQTGHPLRIVSHRISPADPAARAALAKAMEEAVRDDVGTDAMHQHSVAIPDGAGGGYVATLLPVESGHRRGIFAPFAASVAVFMQDPVQATRLPGEAFARLYGLTGGELRVLLALSQGLGGMEAADMLGIGEPTVRTHLQHIFSKTGTSRQADLLRLLHRATPPTRPLPPAAH